MENKQTFSYQYSAQVNKEVESIKSRYLPQEVSKVELLKKLDLRARTAGQLIGLVIGVIGLLIFGIGMCFGLDALAGSDWLTVLFCTVGIVVMAPAYPLYRYIHKRTREKLTPEILRLSEEILGEK